MVKVTKIVTEQY